MSTSTAFKTKRPAPHPPGSLVGPFVMTALFTHDGDLLEWVSGCGVVLRVVDNIFVEVLVEGVIGEAESARLELLYPLSDDKYLELQ